MTEAEPAVERPRGLPAWVRAVVAEPLTHFLAIGLVLFALSGAWRSEARPVVRIDSAEIARLSAFWKAQAQRDPTPQELAGLIAERADEEILYREALRLGLDRDDVIVRRRLAQKLSFLNQDLIQVKEPTDAELRAWHAAHAAEFAAPATATFEHLYFSEDARGAKATADALSALASLEQGGQGDAAALGDPFMLPLSYAEVSADLLRRDYGEGFASAVQKAPLGRWSGPVRSGFGLHLVRVSTRSEGGRAAYESVRGLVRQSWLVEQRRKANARWLASLRGRYRIVVDRGQGTAGR